MHGKKSQLQHIHNQHHEPYEAISNKKNGEGVVIFILSSIFPSIERLTVEKHGYLFPAFCNHFAIKFVVVVSFSLCSGNANHNHILCRIPRKPKSNNSSSIRYAIRSGESRAISFLRKSSIKEKKKTLLNFMSK